MGWNVFVTRELPKPGMDLLRESCERMDVNPHDRVLTRQELLEGVRGRDGVLCLLTDTIDNEVFEAAEGALMFANYAVGFNNIDVDAANRHGMLISNTPGVLTETTADLAWALIFAVARRVVEADNFTRAGKFEGWGPMLLLGSDVYGKTLGIVGGGRIGTAVGLRARGFAMRVLYADVMPSPTLEGEVGARRVELDELCSEADFLTVHVNLTPETTHIIGARELELMKPSAILINNSRGPTVDERALVKALREGQIAGAGLDVYEDEPALAPGLVELENTVLLPHVASATVETRTRMALMAAENLLAGLRGERPPNLVNQEAFDALSRR